MRETRLSERLGMGEVRGEKAMIDLKTTFQATGQQPAKEY